MQVGKDLEDTKKEMGNLSASLPDMVASEVSKQLELVSSGAPASMSTDVPQSMVTSSTSDLAKPYFPMAVEASNLVPFGDIRCNGTPFFRASGVCCEDPRIS